MNVILLAVLALGGTGGEWGSYTEDAGAYADSPGHAQVHGHHGRLHGHMLHGHCLGPMPQTCYDPPYGCYHGSRWSNRYPAFHGTYYRKAYNYRNYFDFPWHAEMHEPTSQWSYHVTGETGQQPEHLMPVAPHGGDHQAPPPPLPTPAAYQAPLAEEAEEGSLIDEVRSLLRSGNLAKTPSSSLRSLRR